MATQTVRGSGQLLACLWERWSVEMWACLSEPSLDHLSAEGLESTLAVPSGLTLGGRLARLWGRWSGGYLALLKATPTTAGL